MSKKSRSGHSEVAAICDEIVAEISRAATTFMAVARGFERIGKMNFAKECEEPIAAELREFRKRFSETFRSASQVVKAVQRMERAAGNLAIR